MTRLRVLTLAREYLSRGYLPQRKPLCLDPNNREVTPIDPAASQFTPVAAIQKAIFITTHQHWSQRDRLYTDTLEGFFHYYGGESAAFDKLRDNSKSETLAVIDTILKKWRQG